MKDETRSLKRRHLVYYLEVYDDDANDNQEQLLLTHVLPPLEKIRRCRASHETSPHPNRRLKFCAPDGIDPRANYS